ncbi:hypothetical protein EHQ96_17720 [Leptospira levettii]|uniref:Lipoprotein n=2 Tax=Leptospira levettii TaxID=2023178 RepID=A0ABY2MQZ7_9LEPT|nr:hypothetical protein EHQ34_03180 [Leptospira levettii]TGL11710.1 hypothetical protein EHQ39_05670 [Leptospira levettii]TGL73238.1 hypothetical protein EHQ60_05660 [Leptospira levettii]TGM25949.1 hypothetical protein EHQ74_11530 [Leptospira levettii]TGM33461.1 hypothetical protein EHQ71_06690 [Leptospira levettii]
MRPMKPIRLILVSTLFFIGCGSISRGCAKYFGYDEVCVDGVKYIQFTSGASVKYNPDGSIATCR